MITSYGDNPQRMGRTISWLLNFESMSNIRAVSFSFWPPNKSEPGQVVVRVHYFKAPTEDELELLKDFEAEIYAQTWKEFRYVIETQTTPIRTKMDMLPHTAWIDGAEAFRTR